MEKKMIESTLVKEINTRDDKYNLKHDYDAIKNINSDLEKVEKELTLDLEHFNKEELLRIKDSLEVKLFDQEYRKDCNDYDDQEDIIYALRCAITLEKCHNKWELDSKFCNKDNMIYLEDEARNQSNAQGVYYLTFSLDMTEALTQEELQAWFDIRYPAEKCHHEYDCCGSWYNNKASIINFEDDSKYFYHQKRNPLYSYKITIRRTALQNI